MIHDLNLFDCVFSVYQDKYITSVSHIKSFHIKYADLEQKDNL